MIELTKSVFARHEIPRIVKSDNGPQQFISDECKKFSEAWGFNYKHVMTSPYNPQAIGLAEKSVQIIKRILKKAKTDKQDPYYYNYLSLLEYRNTMVKEIGSPAQLSMSRRLNLILPCTPEQLAPKVINPRKALGSMRQAQEKVEQELL